MEREIIEHYKMNSVTFKAKTGSKDVFCATEPENYKQVPSICTSEPVLLVEHQEGFAMMQPAFAIAQRQGQMHGQRHRWDMRKCDTSPILAKLERWNHLTNVRCVK